MSSLPLSIYTEPPLGRSIFHPYLSLDSHTIEPQPLRIPDLPPREPRNTVIENDKLVVMIHQQMTEERKEGELEKIVQTMKNIRSWAESLVGEVKAEEFPLAVPISVSLSMKRERSASPAYEAGGRSSRRIKKEEDV
jgi:hypothetical protein